MFCNWTEAPLKFVALSHNILVGKDRLAMKRSRVAKKASEERELTTSRCTALVTKHTNKASQHLSIGEFLLGPVLKGKGPPKSTPTLMKGLPCSNRLGGKSAI
uniref:Uncharacterized protein n=1 Tax=Cacopsylla melanoneura TaxID=428564 RepID=A0A8D8TYQ8_9HEMI